MSAAERRRQGGRHCNRGLSAWDMEVLDDSILELLDGVPREFDSETRLALHPERLHPRHLQAVGLEISWLFPGYGELKIAADFVLQFHAPFLAVLVTAANVRAGDFDVLERSRYLQPKLLHRRVLNLVAHQRASAHSPRERIAHQARVEARRLDDDLRHAAPRARAVQMVRPTSVIEVLPRERDSKNPEQPLTAILPGDIYQKAGRWDQISVHQSVKRLREQEQLLNKELNRPILTADAYVDRVILTLDP